MKLSRKIGFTYIIALFFGIFICLTFFMVFLNASRDGERLRSAEISQGVRSKMLGKINEFGEKGKLYKVLLDKVPMDAYGDRYIDNLKIDEILSSIRIDFEGILNLDTDIINSIFKNELIDYTNYEYVLSKIKEVIRSGIAENNSGIISLNDKAYLINYIKLKEGNSYIILIRNIDEGFYKELGKSTGSSINITKDIGLNRNGDKAILEEVEYIFGEEGKDIYSYSIIDTLNDEKIYLEVMQYKLVESSITYNFIRLMIIICVIVIGINVGLYSFINKKVIRRILFVNDEVHKVSRDENSRKKLIPAKINDEITHLSISINDMLDRIEMANSRVKASENKYRSIINSMTNGFIFCKMITVNNKVDGVIYDANEAATDLLNLSDWKERTISSIFGEVLNCNEVVIGRLNELKDKSYLVIEKEIELADNRWGSISITAIEDSFFFIIINDVTKIKLYSEEMTYLANYDALTSIYNRRKLLNYIDDLEKDNISYNLFYIDLDGFKKLNDSLGHEKGDWVLKDVSKELLTLISDEIKIGRLGGDEFVVIMVGGFNEERVLKLGDIILDLLNKKYEFDKLTYTIKGSIGISNYPKDGKNSSAVMKFADIAMYNSKLKGGNCLSIFNNEIRERYELENKIKEAMSRDEFFPYLQPIYNIIENKFDGVETLIRWNSKEGVLTPDKFLNVARSNGLIAELDKNMFKSSCRFCSRWKRRYGQYVTISVNISNSLLTKTEFVQFILDTIESYNIPYNYIRLEITEDEIIKDIKYVVSILNYLRDRGVKIALDDFGTGYSSYNYINMLPLDSIKIDKSLITNIENDEKTLSIIQSLIELSKFLSLEVICEGIENKEQLDILTNLGCDKIQGFIFSEPISEEKLFNYIDKFNNN